jgi:hypothetical protein
MLQRDSFLNLRWQLLQLDELVLGAVEAKNNCGVSRCSSRIWLGMDGYMPTTKAVLMVMAATKCFNIDQYFSFNDDSTTGY